MIVDDPSRRFGKRNHGGVIVDEVPTTLQVIWEIEPGTSIEERINLPQPDGFDTPDRLDAFLNAVRWGAVSSADVSALIPRFREMAKEAGPPRPA